MNIGMMWHTIKNTTLLDGITEAKKHYISKYGFKPNVCQVNPAAIPEDLLQELTSKTADMNIKLVAAPYILKGCLWIGIED